MKRSWAYSNWETGILHPVLDKGNCTNFVFDVVLRCAETYGTRISMNVLKSFNGPLSSFGDES